jgi:predicted amidohydrolase YtcJ
MLEVAAAVLAVKARTALLVQGATAVLAPLAQSREPKHTLLAEAAAPQLIQQLRELGVLGVAAMAVIAQGMLALQTRAGALAVEAVLRLARLAALE